MPDLGSNVSSVWTAGDGIDIVFLEEEGEYTVITVENTGGASAGVSSISESGQAQLTGDVTLSEGSNITLTQVGNDIAIASSGGAGGHTIRENGVDLTARTGLNFVNGLVASDDAVNDETEVRADYGAVTAETSFGLASSNGAATSVSRSDHTHGTPAAPAPVDADYLVGTANGTLSGEIVVGTSPGGELGGTWAAPTVDATHSGSAHHTQSHDHSVAGDGTTLTPATLNIPATAAPNQTADGQVVWDSDDNLITVGTGTTTKIFYTVNDVVSDPTAVSTASSDGTEASLARKDHVHAHEAAHINHDTTWAAKGDLIAGTANDTAQVLGVGANDTILMADSGQATGMRWQAPASTTEIADIADTEDAGTSDTWARGDHVHSGAAYVKESGPRHLVTFSKTGNLSTGTGTLRWYNDTGSSITLDSARGSVGTAPASQSILIDVNNNGTSVWNATQANRITIAAAGNTDEGGAFDDATIADGEYLTVDIDQVGSGTVGADLTVSIWGHWS